MSPGVDSEPHDGSRLRGIWWTAADGARQHSGLWRDTELQLDCTFALASDGVMRCLPPAPAVFVGYYRDATCSPERRWFVRVAGCSDVPFGTSPSDGCPAGTARFELAAAMRPERIWTGSAGACSEAPAPETFDFFTVVREVPPREFVAVTAGE